MTELKAAAMVKSQVQDRAFQGKITDTVRDDWETALKRRWVEEDKALTAFGMIVEEGWKMEPKQFYRAYKRAGGGKVAEQGKPVCLFGILPERHVESYNDPVNPLKECLIKWFYTNHPKYVPNPQKMAEQAAYWAHRLQGRIIYAEGFGPQDDPF